MKKFILTACAGILALSSADMMAQPSIDGYYKDVFMDGGVYLSSRIDLPATRVLGLSLELVKGAGRNKNQSYADTTAQNAAFVGNEYDVNGVLLYPDGAPRFRLLYVNGGSGATHGRTITDAGRQHIREFVKGGGSYLGSCAGAYLCCQGTHKKDSTGRDYNKYYKEYIGVYPGVCTNAGLANTFVSIDVPENSPALKYYDFKNNHIDSVYHNGGCFMPYEDLIEGGEILFNYNYPPKKMHGNGAVWCHKENEYTGRAMACGPHPEGEVRGAQLDMMCAMVRYCLDGNGLPRIKGELVKGQPREMTCITEDNKPEYTRIGDRQYHHFTVDVPAGIDTLDIILKEVPGYNDFNLFLFADSDDMAFIKNARYKNVKRGVKKVLRIIDPKPGKMYVSVFCETTVEATETFYGTQYTGRVDVLNGVPYVIEVNY